MSRQSQKVPDTKRVPVELFTLTYGALVAGIMKDYETDHEINEQLDQIGFNIGLRLVEDYLVHNNCGRCSDLKEASDALIKAFRMFIGVTPSAEKFSPTGDEFSLILPHNPLTDFVHLPHDHPNLLYSNVLAGVVRGALHNVQLEVDVRFVQDKLRGDEVNEIRIKYLRRITEVTVGEE